MITIVQDSEILTNLLAVNPVPASNHFFAFTDERKRPAVLSHSEDDKLNLIINVDDKPRLNDLGNIWGLTGSIQACALLQDTNMKVSITVATNASNSKSHFYLIHDVMPRCR